MCGDGANDCSALKASDVGISLSEAEASIAAPFTSKVQNISCVVNLIREGKSSLVTAFSAFKFYYYYNMVTFFAAFIMYTHLHSFLHGMWIYSDLVALFPLTILQARTEAWPKLTADIPTQSLFYPPVILSVILTISIQIFFNTFIYYNVQK